MRALVWVVEETWEGLIDAARELLPAEAEATLLYVAPSDVEEVARGAVGGLLGRRPRPEASARLTGVAQEAAAGLLEDAARRLGRPAARVARAGRVEREVVAAAGDADLLLAARDGDRRHPGPRSLGPATRFVVDHAPCTVVLVWPDGSPPAPHPPPGPPPPPSG